LILLQGSLIFESTDRGVSTGLDNKPISRKKMESF